MDSRRPNPRPPQPVPQHAAALSRHAQIERISEPWSINRTLAVCVALVLALCFGSWVANGQFDLLILVAVWFVAASIIIFVRDHWWTPMLVIYSLAFSTNALGFPLSGLEFGVIILALTLPVKMAMKTLRKAEPEMQPGTLYWLLLGYVVIHAAIIIGYNKVNAVPLKNIYKAYYEVLAPLILYGLLIRYCAARTLKPALIAIFVATAISVFFAFVTILTGLNVGVLPGLKITVGWLDQAGAQGILRTSAVALFVGGLAFWPVLRGMPKNVVGAFTLLSAVGVIESGGRLSLATAIGAAILFAMVRGRILLALPVIAFTALVSGVITADPEILYSLPILVQRGLTPLNLSHQQTEVQQTLQGSDNWHRELRNESFIYWTEDGVSLLFGHGYKSWDYSLSSGDDTEDYQDYERRKTLAIEMGLTENMFSSITNIFGLMGFILYMAFFSNLALQLWKGRRASPEGSIARATCEYSLVTLLAALVTCFVQGVTPNIGIVYWALGLLAARPYIAQKKSLPSSNQPQRPAFARPAYAQQPALAPHRVRPARA